MIGDIDIDVADRKVILSKLKHRVGSIRRERGKLEKHNSGVYFQDIPYNPLTGFATLDHREAARLGYYKVDILNLSIYEDVRDEAHLLEVMEREPNWELLQHVEIVDSLFQLHGHHDVLVELKPQSIEDLAMVLAVIRPSKRHLLSRGWETIRREIWKPTGDYYFKKSHSTAYAVAIIVQLNLLVERLEAMV